MIWLCCVRLVFAFVLVGLGLCLWFYPLITLIALYLFSWFALWNDIGATTGYHANVHQTFDCNTGELLEDKTVEYWDRPPLPKIIWGLVKAPFTLVGIIIYVIRGGGFPIA